MKRLAVAVDGYLEDTRIVKHGSFRLGLTAEMAPYERYLSIMELRNEWNLKDYWLSTFAKFKFDTFNDGYFPTRGIRFSLNGRYVFNGYWRYLDANANVYREEWKATTEGGRVPHYVTGRTSLEAAFSIGDHFTILPKLYNGWYHPFGVDLEEHSIYHYVNPLHTVGVGGFLPDRYTESQLPFFLWTNGYRDSFGFSTVAQLDLRYSFLRKNYLTVRGGVYQDVDYLELLFRQDPIWAVGAEYARQTMVGPLRLAAQWAPAFGLTMYASIGFDF